MMITKNTSLLLIASFLFYTETISQNCKVEKEELKGTYTGDCKKGKANGKGKATGVDSYEGDFISGLPHGKGSYTWKNGDVYTGEFIKGLKDGEGKMIIKLSDNRDSLIEGYWQNDKYTGLKEKPWRLIFKSKLVTESEVEYKDHHFNKITFVITNTSGGSKLVEGDEMPRLKVDEVIPQRGNFGRLFVNDIHAKKTESLIEDINFPFRFRAIIGTEEVEMEFIRPGNYIVTLRIND
jgi:hypothetical protein